MDTGRYLQFGQIIGERERERRGAWREFFHGAFEEKSEAYPVSNNTNIAK